MSVSLDRAERLALIDSVFADPETKHGLTVFTEDRIASLPIRLDGTTIRIRCLVRDREVVAKPEEIVRQLYLQRLVEDLKYPLEVLAVEVRVRMGAGYAPTRADIFVYTDRSKTTPHAIVEVKKPTLKNGLDQLHSYMNATGTYFGCWVNGKDEIAHLRADPNIFEEIPRLPAQGEGVDDVKAPILKRDLRPITDLKAEIQYLEDTVLANAGVSTFEEIFKLIFAKLYDEFTKADDDVVDFRTTTESPRDQYKRFQSLFEKATSDWSDIFTAADKIELSPEALVTVASAFQTRRLFDSDLDVVDAAFEYLVNPEQKGDKGQYFTPRPVIKMCVKMMNPKRNERVLDPACGAGGFLIHALNWVFEREIAGHESGNLAKRRFDYASGRLFGIDFDLKLVRVAKAMMLIAGDGRSNVYHANSLDPRDWAARTDGLTGAIPDEHFDVLLTNPPFAGNINQAEILGTYDLAFKGDPTTNKMQSKVRRDILFIERALRFLKPGGRMGIVLPQGNLNNPNSDYLRAWFMNRARVLAVVGLHTNTFKPFTNTKTSVVFLQKATAGEEMPDDYRILMAINRRPVRDSSGRYNFRRAADGSIDHNPDGTPIVDHDLDEIADAFVEFALAEELPMWKNA